MQKLKHARVNMFFFNVWKFDPKLMFKNNDNGKSNAYYG